MESITIRGNQFVLSHHKAIFWENQKSLILSDTHLGKSIAFQRAGIPVPSLHLRDDLLRISKLIADFGADRLLILGDFLHSRKGNTETLHQELLDWRKGIEHIKINLVSGNHDKYSGELPYLNIQESENLIESEFLFTHEPQSHSSLYNFCGHIHPAFVVRGKAKQKLRLPCFYFGKFGAILPSFGSFTGSAEMLAKKGDRIFCIAEDKVVEVKKII